MSTPQERLDEVYTAYSNAYQRRFADLKEATSKAQARQILTTVRNLEAHYLKAARAALAATGNAVEKALKDAKKARDEIDAAYKGAADISKKIQLVGAGAKLVGELVKKAQA